MNKEKTPLLNQPNLETQEIKQDREISQLERWISEIKQERKESELLTETLLEIQKKHDATQNPYLFAKLSRWVEQEKRERGINSRTVSQLEQSLVWLSREKKLLAQITELVTKRKEQINEKKVA